MRKTTNPPAPPPRFDDLLPPEMARAGEAIGVRKASLNVLQTAVLALLAGAFIAFGAIFATVSLTGTADVVPWGWSRVIAGLVFSLGLVLVIVGGAELFTGNNLIVMAWANRKITTRQLLRNWAIVYVGNFVGAAGIALVAFLARHHMLAGGGVGLTALEIGLSKVQLGFFQAIALGILCNTLVCLAVWLTFSARNTIGRIVAVVFPISAFVAAGFEHCVANMYFLPFATMVRLGAPDSFWRAIGKRPAAFAELNCLNCLWGNLLPVTIGNILGGAVFVGAVYWLVYLRRPKRPAR